MFGSAVPVNSGNSAWQRMHFHIPASIRLPWVKFIPEKPPLGHKQEIRKTLQIFQRPPTSKGQALK